MEITFLNHYFDAADGDSANQHTLVAHKRTASGEEATQGTESEMKSAAAV